MTISSTYQNYSPDWWTPPEWWQWIEETLMVSRDEIFDPCPGSWQPPQESGLAVNWRFPAYVNHPGSRGSAKKWWAAYHRNSLWHYADKREPYEPPFIWCAFNEESIRHLYPSPWQLDGWMVMPRTRTAFIWGGPTYTPAKGKPRVHGEPVKSPGNYTVWWTTEMPARPPVECVITKTHYAGFGALPAP